MELFGYPDYTGSNLVFNWGAAFCSFVAVRSGVLAKIGFNFPDEGTCGSRFAIYDSTDLLAEVSVEDVTGWHVINIGTGQNIVEGQTYYIAQIPFHGTHYCSMQMKSLSGSTVYSTDAPEGSLDDYPFPSTVPESWAGEDSDSVLCLAAYSNDGLPLLGSISNLSAFNNSVSVLKNIISNIYLYSLYESNLNNYQNIIGNIRNINSINNILNRKNDILGIINNNILIVPTWNIIKKLLLEKIDNFINITPLIQKNVHLYSQINNNSNILVLFNYLYRNINAIKSYCDIKITILKSYSKQLLEKIKSY